MTEAMKKAVATMRDEHDDDTDNDSDILIYLYINIDWRSYEFWAAMRQCDE